MSSNCSTFEPKDSESYIKTLKLGIDLITNEIEHLSIVDSKLQIATFGETSSLQKQKLWEFSEEKQLIGFYGS